MIPEVKNVILASADQVAIDAVSAKMMGHDPMSIEYINVAHNQGLGTGDVRDIEIVGDDISNENWHFSVDYNLVKIGAAITWFGPLKGMQNLLFRTPLVHVFILMSEVYHDYYRWGMIDKKIFQKWKETTAWGKLFDKY